MAEQIPFSIAESLRMKTGLTAFQEIASMYGFGNELRKLERSLPIIKAVLGNAEERQLKEPEVVDWVRKFKDAVYDADDLLDEFTTQNGRRTADIQGRIGKQISYFFSSSNQLLFRFKILCGMKHIAKRLDDIEKYIDELNLIQGVTTLPLEENRQRESHNVWLISEVFGRDQQMEAIVELLMQSSGEENLSTVAIVGMGGLGKTTLAQLVYNHERVVKYFDLRMWVCVSRDFEVKILVRNIIRSATGVHVQNLELDQLKIQLHKELNQKRYLLVLDDVWNENPEKWDELRTLLSIGANGSKIVVTTRSRRVASIAGIQHYLTPLTQSESWALFEKAAFRHEETVINPNLLPIGREIMRMCHGIPLFIEILGAMLRYKTEATEWSSIASNEHLISLGDGGDVRPFLMISYDSLPKQLKQCFSYCSLFPINYEFEKNLLVKLWMAQGYIHPLHENDNLEDIGDQYFEALLSRSLFQEVQLRDSKGDVLSCKMHDLIHDLAQWVGRSEVCILTNDVMRISEGVHHVSLFLLSDPDSKDDAIGNTIISSCWALRVLHLNALIDKKVPESIVKLIQLRYLDLSDNDFEVLPGAITMLQNLQTLRLLRCGKLKELPGDIEKLLNLRHLEIQGCERLTHMPSGSGQLSMLRSLPLFVVGNDSVSHGMLSELKRLDHLRGELRIANLKRLKGHMALELMEANLKGKAYLQSLELEWQDQWHLNAEEVMEGLQPHENLKELNIKRYGGERFPSWMMNDGLGSLLPRLIRIEMRNCEQCKVLPPLGLLPHLKYLELVDLSALEYMQESSPEMSFFPALEILRLYKLRNVKGWLKDVTAEQDLSFLHLSELIVSCCHNLISLPLHSSPFLSQFDMNHCDNFTSLLLPSSSSLS